MNAINLQVITKRDVLFAASTKQLEVIEIGWTETTYTLTITEGVSVKLYEESGQGLLRIDDQEFEFILTNEMVQVLNEWDNMKPTELFAALYRNRCQAKVQLTYIA